MKLFRPDPARFPKKVALSLCILITVIMMVFEFVVGYRYGSLMLVSDGFHMLSHAGSLAISLLALVLSRRWKSDSGGESIPELLAALINGVGLVAFTVFIVRESIARMAAPESIELFQTAIVACFGLFINLLTALILSKSGVEDLNSRSAYLHMLADTFSSVAILVGLLIIRFTGWMIIDPILSLIVAFVIAKWAWQLFRDAIQSWKLNYRVSA